VHRQGESAKGGQGGGEIMDNDRLQMFERYIHLNACSDTNGWFGYFCPNGDANESYDVMEEEHLMIFSCETEEEALQELIKLVCDKAQVNK